MVKIKRLRMPHGFVKRIKCETDRLTGFSQMHSEASAMMSCWEAERQMQFLCTALCWLCKWQDASQQYQDTSQYTNQSKAADDAPGFSCNFSSRLWVTLVLASQAVSRWHGKWLEKKTSSMIWEQRFNYHLMKNVQSKKENVRHDRNEEDCQQPEPIKQHMNELRDLHHYLCGESLFYSEFG